MLLFLIAVVFLVRSMTKHLKRVPESFDPPSDEPTEPTEAEASESQEKPKTTNGS
jgi:Na+-transporting methylmalonyl-CoA/oxaloacetate decarboxylase gamma subunit